MGHKGSRVLENLKRTRKRTKYTAFEYPFPVWTSQKVTLLMSHTVSDNETIVAALITFYRHWENCSSRLSHGGLAKEEGKMDHGKYLFGPPGEPTLVKSQP